MKHAVKVQQLPLMVYYPYKHILLCCAAGHNAHIPIEFRQPCDSTTAIGYGLSLSTYFAEIVVQQMMGLAKPTQEDNFT